MAEAQTITVTRYDCKVHARNLNSDYGLPTTVYAESRQDAANKAVEVAWSGRPSDARVTFLRVVQEVVVVPSEMSQSPAGGDDRG